MLSGILIIKGVLVVSLVLVLTTHMVAHGALNLFWLLVLVKAGLFSCVIYFFLLCCSNNSDNSDQSDEILLKAQALFNEGRCEDAAPLLEKLAALR